MWQVSLPAVLAHLRDASYKGAARLGHGKGYHSRAADGPFWRLPATYHRTQWSYAATAKTAPPETHSYEGHWVAQQYLPDLHKDRRFYNPSDQGYEAEVKARVERWRAGED